MARRHFYKAPSFFILFFNCRPIAKPKKSPKSKGKKNSVHGRADGEEEEEEADDDEDEAEEEEEGERENEGGGEGDEEEQKKGKGNKDYEGNEDEIIESKSRAKPRGILKYTEPVDVRKKRSVTLLRETITYTNRD